MADLVEFKIENIDGLKRAYELAPKTVIASIFREFKREGDKFKTEYRKQYLFGPPGINLPKRLVSFTKTGKEQTKRRTNRDAKKMQLANVRTKVIRGKRTPVLVAYLSRFLTYHKGKLEAPFRAMFRSHAATLNQRITREVARITQAVLDKGLRDAKRGRR